VRRHARRALVNRAASRRLKQLPCAC